MRQNNKVIVLTGGIASGKSTMGKILKDKGYQVVESDKIVHKLYKKSSKVYTKLIKEFGEEIEGDTEINRKRLGAIVYEDKSKINKLNKIVHKHVVEELIEEIKNNKDNIIFLDIPLMIEEKENLKKYGLKYDEIWLIKSREDIRIKRIVNRDKISEEEAKKIIDNQMTDEKKEKYADRIIENNGDIEELSKKIDNILTNIKIEK